MNQTASVQGLGTDKEAREYLKLQLAHHLELQPESTHTFHRWMKRLEAASLGIVVGAFIVAMYVSINWTTVPQRIIPVAWFFYVASAAPAIVLFGLHAAILRVFPPIVLPGKMQKFVTGNEVMWKGWAVVVMGLAIGAFWGFFAYTVGTLNLAMLEPLIRILGVVLGVGIAIRILLSIVQKISKTR